MATSAHRYFQRLVLTSSVVDLQLMMRIHELRNNIYIVDTIKKEVSHPRDFSVVSWPTVWLLGGHSRKHIVEKPRPTSLFSDAVKQLASIKNRVLWRHWFDANPSHDPWWHIKGKRQYTPGCDKLAAPEVKWWINTLHSKLLDKLSEIVNTSRPHQ